MRTLSAVLAIVLLSVTLAKNQVRTPRSSSQEHWSHIISDYIRGASNYYQDADKSQGQPQTGSNSGVPFPLLIVPVPVHVKSKENCKECKDHDDEIGNRRHSIAEQVNNDFYTPHKGPQPSKNSKPQVHANTDFVYPIESRFHQPGFQGLQPNTSPNKFVVHVPEDEKVYPQSNQNSQDKGRHQYIIVKEPKPQKNAYPQNQQYQNNPYSQDKKYPQDQYEDNNKPQDKGQHQYIVVKEPKRQNNAYPQEKQYLQDNDKPQDKGRHQYIVVKEPKPQNNPYTQDQQNQNHSYPQEKQYPQDNEKPQDKGRHQYIVVKEPKPQKNAYPTNPLPQDKEVYSKQPKHYGEEIIFERRTPEKLEPATSEELLEQFHNQFVKNPELPPALIDKNAFEPTAAISSAQLLDHFHSEPSHHQHQDLPPAVIDTLALDAHYDEDPDYDEEEETYGRRKATATSDGHYSLRHGFTVESAPQTPPTPRWNYSLKLKGELHVPRADYTEPYQMWYNEKTGASRIDFHDEGARTYRMIHPDGRVQRVAMRIDRLGESNIPECHVAPPEHMSQEELYTPGLPDMSEYHFNGYETVNHIQHERWSRTVQTDEGKHGSVGEILTYNHEVLATRNNGKSVPVSYSVKVDSSMLGPGCDEYQHRYHEVKDHDDDPSIFDFNIEKECGRLKQADPSNLEDLAHLEPLREFTLPTRDERYDQEFKKFQEQFQRQYADDVESAIRTNLFVQSSRFVTSGNRQSATFELEVNFLGDRLQAEIQQLLGVNVEEAFLGNPTSQEDFPHPETAVRRLARKLPKKFDWRPRGAVTDVKWQGSCASCWAFAVAGAVEGALYVKRKVLVPLSEQCLVDCGHPFGTHGCGGTWPQFAYDYVKERGLPASEEYGPYKEKVDSCHERQTTPVTHISAYVNVTQRSVPALQVAIRRHSPSVVIIDATAKSFIHYKRGVLYDDRCGKTLRKLNHAVVAVGWGEHRKTTHFILKNSWSAAWGEAGYIRLQGPANTCGVLEQPSYPRLEESDIVTQAGRNQ